MALPPDEQRPRAGDVRRQRMSRDVLSADERPKDRARDGGASRPCGHAVDDRVIGADLHGVAAGDGARNDRAVRNDGPYHHSKLDSPLRICNPGIEGDVHLTVAVTEVHDASSYDSDQ